MKNTRKNPNKWACAAPIDLPLKGSELEIGGQELMQMGFKGKEIGQAQRDILSAIHRGEFGNTYDEIVGYLK